MTTIYGECLSGEAYQRVVISRLAAEGCEITFAAAGPAAGDELTLWIGAIGPLSATTDASIPSPRQRRLAARFDEPLAPAIVAHFAA